MTPTFTHVATLWKADKRQYVKKSTYAIYAQLCNTYILPEFGDGTRLIEDDFQAFANRLLARGYAIKTMKDTMLVLKMIIRYSEKLGAWPHVEFKLQYARGGNAAAGENV